MRKPRLNVNRLKEQREKKGWSKNYAAEEMGLAQSVYLRYESGECAPSYSAIRNMALTLGTSVEYLTDRCDDDMPNEYIVSSKDHRLEYIIDLFTSSDSNCKERLYEYAQKIDSRIK